jgi:hypothetical protein
MERSEACTINRSPVCAPSLRRSELIAAGALGVDVIGSFWPPADAAPYQVAADPVGTLPTRTIDAALAAPAIPYPPM